MPSLIIGKQEGEGTILPDADLPNSLPRPGAIPDRLISLKLNANPSIGTCDFIQVKRCTHASRGTEAVSHIGRGLRIGKVSEMIYIPL
jgi:hypothetical protein